jgi:cysteine protease ATG4
VYIPQVLSLLEIEQSVGIIGGSSHSSYYFIGHQNNILLYLDPHMVHPAALNKDSVTTCSSTAMQSMQASSMDSSASFGFLCRNNEDLDTLMSSLAAIEDSYAQYPIMCVKPEGSEPPFSFMEEFHDGPLDSNASSNSSWELV